MCGFVVTKVIRGVGLLGSHVGKLASFYNRMLLMQRCYPSSTWVRWRCVTAGGHLGSCCWSLWNDVGTTSDLGCVSPDRRGLRRATSLEKEVVPE